MKLAIIVALILFSSCAPYKVMKAWDKDDAKFYVKMLSEQGCNEIKIDTLKDGTFNVKYRKFSNDCQ